MLYEIRRDMVGRDSKPNLVYFAVISLMKLRSTPLLFLALVLTCSCTPSATKEGSTASFNAMAFYTAKNDKAHISFVHEANKWFSAFADSAGFRYDSTDNWSNLNEEHLKEYNVVIFLDTRPEDSLQRMAFRKYVEAGGGFMGFHFSAFALNDSDFPQDWDWYHDEFIGAGQFRSNTWRPTSAILRIEDNVHPTMASLPETFSSAPSEWYRWEKDLRENNNIQILLSIDSSSFPLGTGPKLDEIWHEGYYPVMWTNKNYRMVYMNMGHNDMDYEGGTDQQLSSTFASDIQNQMIMQTLLWLGKTTPN
jgi:uncharacterized protein